MSWWNDLDPQRLRGELKRYEDWLPCEAQRQAVARYHRRRRAEHIKPSTLGAQAGVLLHFGTWLGDRAFEDVKEEDLERYFDELGVRKKASVLYHQWVILKRFYQDLTGAEEPAQLGAFRIRRPEAHDLQASDLGVADKVMTAPRTTG